ncbi:Hsp33 family molecular chaperone HslO [Shewanella algae]|uniref:Hsp33 family molecular chaperone HslO n=1 Tax=Shewanella algae TaxID=38313 RepID=UPI001BF01F6F|nr:Hsp33 family molecular chaperone HslO [Shewanella algae]MDV2963325.1 Hsp33 family molecular chaperone HslO [Shewanella algae]BCV47518.1 33 kDa chaperonin [Shewanella algae]
MNQDTLHRYLFDNADVRGELAQLSDSYRQIVNTHDYPERLKVLLGELLAATSLLTATLKFEGDISVQLQGQGGPVSLAVINGNNRQELRGVARWQGEIAADKPLEQLFGQGYMVITLTPTEGERYQGVVALDKPSIAECLESYFAQSEQLPTGIWLFADGEHAAGMLLQVLPSEQSENTEFEHLTQLTATIKAEELFSLPATEVLRRLYHQEQVRLFDPVSVSFKCTCSRERSAAAIRTLAKEEIDAIIQEKGLVEMGCEYCNSHYRFDAIDIEAIFANAQAPDTPQ